MLYQFFYCFIYIYFLSLHSFVILSLKKKIKKNDCKFYLYIQGFKFNLLF